MLNEAVIALDLFNCLNEGNVKSLATMIQDEFLKKIKKRSYGELSVEEKSELATYIEKRSAEIKKLVSGITSDSNEQSFIYDVLMNKEQTFPEDFDDVKSAVQDFTKIRKSNRFTGERDINKYKSFADLHKAVYDFKAKIKERKFQSNFNIGTKILNYNDFTVYKLENGDFKAFSQFIKDNNIAWCVKDKKFWNEYGSPYYYIEKDNKPFALLHYKSEQFMDVHDNGIGKSAEVIKLLAELEKKTSTTFEPWKINIYRHQHPGKSLTDVFLKFYPNAKLNDGLIDCAGSVSVTDDFVKEGKLAIKFGKVDGNFSCDDNQLTSLEGCPQEVDGNFSCDDNQLTSLEGCPQEVGGDFSCSHNQLTSLEGAPQKVSGGFYCRSNRLTSLKGAPQKVGANFSCDDNQLTSLEGCPQEVGGDFSCSRNQLTSLEGAPQKVSGGFYCRINRLTSLKGAPQKVGANFWCNDNQLTSLEGAPQEVGGNFSCNDNQLTSLKGAPQEVSGGFWCDDNQLTSLEGCPQEVSDGYFSCTHNQLTSLEGAPQKISGYFSCTHNQLTSLEGAPQKIGGNFYCNNNSARFTEEQVRAVCNVGGSIKV